MASERLRYLIPLPTRVTRAMRGTHARAFTMHAFSIPASASALLLLPEQLNDIYLPVFSY